MLPIQRCLCVLAMVGLVAPPGAAPAASSPAAAPADDLSSLNSAPCDAGGRPVAEALSASLRGLLDAGRSAGRDRGIAYRVVEKSAAWERYRAAAGCLGSFDPAALARREERLAFWINVYNSLVVHQVLASGVPGSVLEMPGFFDREGYEIGGRRFSLDQIEHGILRGNRPKQAGAAPLLPPGDARLRYTLGDLDPRLHFALVCGARSCPPVRAYDAERIDAQLEAGAGDYLNGTVRATADGRGLTLPMILNWFEADFGGRRGLLDLLHRHLGAGPARRVLESEREPTLSYPEFDWRLNDAH